MRKKYFFKSQSSLQRKAVGGGLTAAFAFGTVGSGFAGAMNLENENIINLQPKPDKKENIQVRGLPELKHSVFCDKKNIKENDLETIKKISENLYKNKDFKSILDILSDEKKFWSLLPKNYLDRFTDKEKGNIRNITENKSSRGVLIDIYVYSKFYSYNARNEEMDNITKHLGKKDFEGYVKTLYDKSLGANFGFVSGRLETFKNFYAEYLNAANKKKYLKVAFVVALVIIVFMIVYFTTGNKNKQIKDLDNTQKKGNGGADVKNPDSDSNEQTGQGNKENQKTGVFSNKIGRRVAIDTAGASLGMGAVPVAGRLLANSKEKTNNSSVEGSKTESRESYTKEKKDDSGEDDEAQLYDLDVETSGESDTGNKASLVSGENKGSDTDTKEEKQKSKEGYFVNTKEKAGVKNNESGDAEGKEKT